MNERDPLRPLTERAETAPAYWFLGILWIVDAGAGTSVWIPRSTVHEFRVTTSSCRVLNSFAPGGMEQLIKTLAVPATSRTLPPVDMVDDPQKVAAFANNYWGMEVNYSPPDAAAMHRAIP